METPGFCTTILRDASGLTVELRWMMLQGSVHGHRGPPSRCSRCLTAMMPICFMGRAKFMRSGQKQEAIQVIERDDGDVLWDYQTAALHGCVATRGRHAGDGVVTASVDTSKQGGIYFLTIFLVTPIAFRTWSCYNGRASRKWSRKTAYGALAQLVARYVRIVEVRGSNPLCSTINPRKY